MPATRAVRIGLVAAAVAVVAAAAILVNLTLLGGVQPRNDPVGKLSPRASLPSATPASPPPPVAVTVGEADD